MNNEIKFSGFWIRRLLVFEYVRPTRDFSAECKSLMKEIYERHYGTLNKTEFKPQIAVLIE